MRSSPGLELALKEVERHEWADVGACGRGVGKVGDGVAGVADRPNSGAAGLAAGVDDGEASVVSVAQ